MIKITLTIEGMMCPMCEAHVNRTLEKELGVSGVKSNHKKNETVILSDKDISDEEIKQGVLKTGYEIKNIQKEEYKKKGPFSFKK